MNLQITSQGTPGSGNKELVGFKRGAVSRDPRAGHERREPDPLSALPAVGMTGMPPLPASIAMHPQRSNSPSPLSPSPRRKPCETQHAQRKHTQTEYILDRCSNTALWFILSLCLSAPQPFLACFLSLPCSLQPPIADSLLVAPAPAQTNKPPPSPKPFSTCRPPSQEALFPDSHPRSSTRFLPIP